MTSSTQAQAPSIRLSRTRFALIWMNLTNEPFIALYMLTPFIMRKSLDASILQITLFFSLKSVLPLFSFYWSSSLARQRQRLLPNCLWAWTIGRVPFLLLPWIKSVWFLIFAGAVYQLFYRAGIPSTMEILKLNIGKKRRETLFSRLYVLSIVESIVLGSFIGKLLDMHPSTWKMLFFLATLLSFSSIFMQMRIALPPNLAVDKKIPQITTNPLVQPIKDCIYLMRSRPDFAHFQWGFMIGGIGLLLSKPTLALFYTDVLDLSHHQIATARYMWTGCGVIASFLLWRGALNLISIRKLTACITLIFSFFPLLLPYAQKNLLWINVAFFVYGIAQTGSHLIWNLSGTFFARDEDSSKFTSVNILMLGLRGLIGPILGGVLLKKAGPFPVLFASSLICVSATIYMLVKKPTPQIATQD